MDQNQMDQKQVLTTYKFLSSYNNIVVIIENNYNYCGSWVPNNKKHSPSKLCARNF